MGYVSYTTIRLILQKRLALEQGGRDVPGERVASVSWRLASLFSGQGGDVARRWQSEAFDLYMFGLALVGLVGVAVWLWVVLPVLVILRMLGF